MMAMNHDEMMKMYFYFGVDDVQMLFKSWVVNSPREMALSCLVLFLLTLFHEWLRVWRDNLVTSKLRVLIIHRFASRFTFPSQEHFNPKSTNRSLTPQKYHQ